MRRLIVVAMNHASFIAWLRHMGIQEREASHKGSSLVRCCVESRSTRAKLNNGQGV